MEQYIGDYGVAISIVIGAVLITRAVFAGVVKVAEIWQDASETRATADGKIADALEKVSDVAAAAVDAANEAKALISDVKGAVKRRDDEVGEIPKKVVDQMGSELEKLPKAIEEALTPRLQQLFDDLVTRIEEVAKNIPGSTSALVCEQLAGMKDEINTAIRDMITETLAVTKADTDEAKPTQEG